MNKNLLKLIKEIYEKEGNIIQYLKQNHGDLTSLEMIRISYDFQSGNYTHYIKKNPHEKLEYIDSIVRVITGLGVKYESILEAGVGEATTLANVIQRLPKKPKQIFGFDISWSRIRYAIRYLKSKRIQNYCVFTGDLFSIPLANDSIDIVYTSHSIEPNGGREKEALQELMRVTKKYLVLLEPAYEFATLEGKKRMESHGYITKLYGSAIDLGLNVMEHRLFRATSGNSLNPTGLIIIKKDLKSNRAIRNPLVCPLTKTPLQLIRGSYFSKESMLVYPVIDGVPCLLSDNAVIATHYLER